MKRIFHLLTILCCITLTACHKNTDPDDKGRCNTVIADYLYGVEYDDYDFKACKDYFDSQYIPSDFGCSEVRRGNFVGRNLDWYINRNASAIIKINHSESHYASIGVVGCFPQFSNDIAKTGKFNEVYKYLPFKTEDGVNEYGLYVGVNVVPTGETSFNPSSWKYGEYGHGAADTNPSAPLTCCVNYLPRILLDKAKTVEEAKEIIRNTNWTDPKDYPHKGESQSFHWLICDANSSCVLEFMDSKPVFTENDIIDKPSFATVMTNFCNCLWEKGIFQTNGIGYERWDKLKKNYDLYDLTFEGMQNLMKGVWYSKSYTEPDGSRYFWLTEFSSNDYPAERLYKNYDLFDNPTFRKIVDNRRALFKDKVAWYTDECELWFTTHTSVYNLDTKTMRVIVHEGYSGMEDFFEASLDTHFEKPLEKLLTGQSRNLN